jgi:hypothetical protein
MEVDQVKKTDDNMQASFASTDKTGSTNGSSIEQS